MPNTKKNHNRKATLMVRLDRESKHALIKAAALRKVSVSDYVRLITVAHASKEVSASTEQLIALTPSEQIAFWTALNNPKKLTPAQKKLGKVMRGEA
jgi:uncharacterized protein (DUF1778 family)